jgi:transposase
MTKAQKDRMLMVRSHLEFVQTSIGKLDKKLDEIVAPFDLLLPFLYHSGVDRVSAITIISEIGTDMSQFTSSKRICCWAGLTPGNNESAGKKNQLELHVLEFTSNLHWCKSPMLP